MRYPSDLDRWIVAYLQGRIDDENKQRLEHWRNESPEHESLFQRLCSELHWKQGVREIASYDEENAWNVVLFKSRKRRMRMVGKWTGIAATVLLLVGVGVSVWLQQSGTNRQLPSRELKNTIWLNMASGESVSLDSIRHITTERSEMRGNPKRLIVQAVETPSREIEWNDIQVPRGADYSLVLADGTEIFLNAETVLHFPDRFEKEGNREVWVEGEAYFKVKRNEKQPFIVHSAGLNVKVLGTEFNIMAYKNMPELQITLVKGKVEVAKQMNPDKMVLIPGKQAVWNREQRTLEKREVDVSYYTAWHEGLFAFRECRLEEVMETLARWYDFEYFFRNTKARNSVYTGKIKRHGTLNEVLDSFRETGELNFEIKGSTVIIK